MKKKFLIYPIAALLALTGCGGGSDTVDSSETDFSEETSETIEITSSDLTGSSEEETSNWPAARLATYMATFLESSVEIPAPSEELDAGRGYSLGNYSQSDAYGEVTTWLELTASGDFTAYGEELVDNGWISLDIYTNLEYYHSPDGSIMIYLLPYASLSGTTTLQILHNEGYYGIWPENALNDGISEITGEEGFAAVPAIKGAAGVYYVEVYSYYVNLWIYGASAYTYEFVLQEAGFAHNRYRGLYLDPTFTYTVNLIDYSSAYGAIILQFLDIDYYYERDWGTTIEGLLASAVTTLAGSDVATVPEPSYDWTLACYRDYVNSNGFIYINVFTYEDGDWADHASDYAEQLNASGSGWTYLESEGGWTDTATESLLLQIYAYTEIGLGEVLSLTAR